MSLNFPIGSDLALRKRYQLLDLNHLRMGKILEVIEMFSQDSCHQYVRGMPNCDDIFFTSIVMSGIQLQNKLRADSDFSLVTYPIATTNSTLTVRTDVLQSSQNSASDLKQVFSTNILVAAR